MAKDVLIPIHPILEPVSNLVTHALARKVDEALAPQESVLLESFSPERLDAIGVNIAGGIVQGVRQSLSEATLVVAAPAIMAMDPAQSTAILAEQTIRIDLSDVKAILPPWLKLDMDSISQSILDVTQVTGISVEPGTALGVTFTHEGGVVKEVVGYPYTDEEVERGDGKRGNIRYKPKPVIIIPS